MAQIPVFQDSQILQPSSPVAIGNANTAMEESISSAGKALFVLGNKLDESQKIAVAKTREYRTQVAASRFEEEMRLFNQQVLWEKHKDITGKQAAQISIAEAEKIRTKITKQFGFLGEDAIKFEGKTREINNNLFPDLMKQSSKIVQDNYEAAKETALNVTIAKVFNSENPGIAFVEEASRIQLSVAQDPDILNKSEQIKKQQLDLANAVVGSFVQRRQFDEAKDFIKQNAQFFGKDAPKEIQNVDKANIEFNNLVYTTGQRKETLRNQEFQKNRQEALSMYTSLLDEARNNQFKYNEVVAKAAADPRLTGEDISSIGRNRAFMETFDDIYEGNIMRRVYSKEIDLEQANTLIEKDYLDGQVSADRRTKMMNAINNTKEAQRRDPTLERLVTQYYSRIEGLRDANSVFDIEGKLYKGAVDKKNDIAKVQFAQRLSQLSAQGRYTPGNIDAVFKEVVGKVYPGEVTGTFGSGKKQIPTGVDLSAVGDPKRAQELIDQEAKYFAANRRRMTKKEISSLTSRVNWYTNQKNESLKKQKVDVITKPSIPSGGKRYDE